MIRRIISFLLLIAACFGVPHVPWLVAWDHSAVAFVAGLRTEDLNHFFLVVTSIGGTYGLLPALILPPILLILRRRFTTAAYFFVGVGLLKLSGILLKIAIARPRPAGALELLATYSMPSGHAANAVIIFGILGVFFWRRLSCPYFRVAVLLGCLIAILLIDFSRVYLGVHFPSDVILGSLYTASGLSILHLMWEDIFDFA